MEPNRIILLITISQTRPFKHTLALLHNMIKLDPECYFRFIPGKGMRIEKILNQGQFIRINLDVTKFDTFCCTKEIIRAVDLDAFMHNINDLDLINLYIIENTNRLYIRNLRTVFDSP